MARQRTATAQLLDDPTERWVAIYCRISRDKRGKQEGVKDQEKLGRAYAAIHFPGWPVKVYTDPSVTATDDDAYRPGWEELQDDIAMGRVHVCIAAEQSRFIRGVERWSAWVTKLTLRGVEPAHSYRSGRLWSPDGDRVSSQIKAVLDEDEARRIKVRSRERNDARAERGVPHLGKPCYGYTVGVDEHGDKTFVEHDTQAGVVRRMAEQVLSGWSLAAIVADLEQRGEQTQRGGAWRTSNVRQLLDRPTLAGLRHRTQLDGSIVEYKGSWAPILDVDTWREVNARLDQRGRKLGRPVTRHLLSGIARCTCGARMYGIQRDVRRRGESLTERVYRCYNVDGCGRVSIAADVLDAFVLAGLRDLRDSPEAARQLSQDDPHAAERKALNARLSKLSDSRRALNRRLADPDDAFGGDDWNDVVAELDAHVERTRAELRALPVHERFDVDAALALLESSDVRVQREGVAVFVDHVLVEPSNGRYGDARATLVPRKL